MLPTSGYVVAEEVWDSWVQSPGAARAAGAVPTTSAVLRVAPVAMRAMAVRVVISSSVGAGRAFGPVRR